MDLATALQSRPLAIVASSRFSARCSNREALKAIWDEGSADDRCPAWLLGQRLRRDLGDELSAKLEQALHSPELGDLIALTRMPIDLVLTIEASVQMLFDRIPLLLIKVMIDIPDDL